MPKQTIGKGALTDDKGDRPGKVDSRPLKDRPWSAAENQALETIAIRRVIDLKALFDKVRNLDRGVLRNEVINQSHIVCEAYEALLRAKLITKFGHRLQPMSGSLAGKDWLASQTHVEPNEVFLPGEVKQFEEYLNDDVNRFGKSMFAVSKDLKVHPQHVNQIILSRGQVLRDHFFENVLGPCALTEMGSQLAADTSAATPKAPATAPVPQPKEVSVPTVVATAPEPASTESRSAAATSHSRQVLGDDDIPDMPPAEEESSNFGGGFQPATAMG